MKKTIGQRIRTLIHKNSYRMDVQELLELSEKLTECIDWKLRLKSKVRCGDLERLEKYAGKTALKNFATKVVETFN